MRGGTINKLSFLYRENCLFSWVQSSLKIWLVTEQNERSINAYLNL